MAQIPSKAWTFSSTKGGLSKNLQLTAHDIPAEKKDHILIEVLNVSLNPVDHKFPGAPVIRWFIKHPAALCFDFCGRIRALPPNQTVNDSRNLHVGQVVWGVHKDIKDLGTLRTNMWVHKDLLFPLPASFPTEHGSALGVGGLTAYQAIAPYAKPNNRVLITGGSGGVGTFCIQVAKALDMYVIATCSQAGAQLCKDLGADEILDYKSPTYLDDLACLNRVDLVVDLVGNDPQLHRRSAAFLKPDGIFILVATMTESWAGMKSMFLSAVWPVWLGGTPRSWKVIFTQNAIKDHEPVAALAEQGKLRVAVDRIFSFEDAVQALEMVESGRVKGKVLIDVGGYSQ